jgi:hypothetical protein
MTFFSKFLAAWRSASRTYTFAHEADTKEFWTQDDARWLQNVFKTYEGQKLKARLDNFIIARQKDAISKIARATYERDCAEANGIRKGIEAIYEHFEGFRPQPRSAASEAEQIDVSLSDFEPIET